VAQGPYAPLAVLKAKAVLAELVFQLERQLAAKEPEDPPALVRFPPFCRAALCL
jgi:hypothetical protein